MERAVLSPAVQLEIPVQGENVSRVQLIGELNQAGFGEIWGEIAILAQDAAHGWRPAIRQTRCYYSAMR